MNGYKRWVSFLIATIIIIVSGILAGCAFPEPICHRIWGKNSVAALGSNLRQKVPFIMTETENRLFFIF